MVEVKNLSVSFKDKVVFNNFNIRFEDKKVTAILGNSGVGKTTLLKAISRLIDFDGDILMTEKGISFAFQSPRLIETLTVIENVEYVLTLDYKNVDERRVVAKKCLENAEISHLQNAFTKNLSAGERQRVNFARAIAKKSQLLIMDEPFSSLDISLKTRLIKLYSSYLETENKTVIFVTHDPYEALLFADNIIVLRNNDFSEFKISQNRSVRDLESQEISCVRKQIYSAIE